MDMQRGPLIHCMHGWRAAFCVLDNLTPHRELPLEADDPPGMSPSLEGRFGFRWACKLHSWAMRFGSYGRED